MNINMYHKLLYIFSSSEIVIIYALMIYTLYYINIYTALLFLLVLFKTTLFKLIKKFFIQYQYGKRPKQAYNCNIFNCGGKDKGGGMPSAHMGFIGIISFIVYNIYMINNDKNQYIIGIYAVIAILTAISRFLLKCHTIPQIITGYLFGLLLAYVFYLIDNKLNETFKIYQENRDEFYNIFH